MSEFVVQVLRIVVICGETDVEFVEPPDVQGVEIGHQHPRSNVKLSLGNDQRVFDVFLHDPLLLLGLGQVKDLQQTLAAADSSAARESRRLGDPDVVLSADVVLLLALLPQLFQNEDDVLLELAHHILLRVLGGFQLGARIDWLQVARARVLATGDGIGARLLQVNDFLRLPAKVLDHEVFCLDGRLLGCFFEFL